MNVPDTMEQRTLIERLARHLAAGAVHNWPYWLEDAANILAMMKEPDAAMRDAGDTATWQAMVDAALRARWSIFPPDMTGADEGAGGTDEEGEVRLPPGAIDGDGANWVQLNGSTRDMP